MFHVARRIVPSARGGKEICTGRTLLVGWPFAATPVSGSCFAFFATDCEPSASEGASVVATLRLGGILTAARTGGRRERRANIIRGRVSLWGHAFMLWVHIYGCLFGGEHVHARQSNCRTSLLGVFRVAFALFHSSTLSSNLCHTMPSLREFSACIVSNNQPLPEHLVAVDKTANKVSCWIPSEAGKV